MSAGVMMSDGPCQGGFGWKPTGVIPDRLIAAKGLDGQIALFDLATDSLEVGEEAHEYERDESMGPAHLCYRGAQRHLSGYWLTYKHVGPASPERVAEVLAGYPAPVSA